MYTPVGFVVDAVARREVGHPQCWFVCYLGILCVYIWVLAFSIPNPALGYRISQRTITTRAVRMPNASHPVCTRIGTRVLGTGVLTAIPTPAQHLCTPHSPHAIRVLDT